MWGCGRCILGVPMENDVDVEIEGADGLAESTVERTTVDTTFEWNHLRFHVITSEPPTESQLVFIRDVLRRLDRVGSFADALGVIFGRHVNLRTTRPEPDIWFEVGL
jgi:hypothetical protein